MRNRTLRRALTYASLLGALLFTPWLAACRGAASSPPPSQDAPSQETSPRTASSSPALVAVSLAEATARRITAGTWAIGRTAPRRRVSPGTKILGRVEHVAIDEGQRVGRGGLLARLESRDLAAGLAQAKAGVSMAEARLEQARGQENRMRALEARGSATAKNLEDAVAGLRVAEAGLAQAHADTEVARILLSYAEIESPIDGWVIARNIEAGDMAQPGTPLFVIEDLSTIEIHVEVPEAEVVGLAERELAEVEVLGVLHRAPIHRIVPAGDPVTRTFRVELLIDNPDGNLKSGMFARARFGKGERHVLAVPHSALVRRGQLDGVLIAGDDGLLRARWITLGAPVDLVMDDGQAQAGQAQAGQAQHPVAWIEVLSGLAAGERYAIDPPGLEADGARYTSQDPGFQDTGP